MIRRYSLWAFLVVTVAASSLHLSASEGIAGGRPFLSPIFGDNMVLQRGKPNTLWGWCRPGEAVTVAIGDVRVKVHADPDGEWRARIEPPRISGECSVVVDGSSHVELRHVLVGDVWLCGGQSNMAFGLSGVKDAAREIAGADHPRIRFFDVGSKAAYEPEAVPKGSWKVCTPASVVEGPGLSAVAYFFACKVQADTGVPIGLVVDAVGGTPVECWMAADSLQTLPDFSPPMVELRRLRAQHAPAYGSYLMHWLDDYDAGNRGKTWGDEAADDSHWKRVRIPGAFSELGVSEVPSVVWFRREVTLPNPLPPGKAILKLGQVEKMDTAYLNGHWTGASSWVENPRAYTVAEGVLHPGTNRIALRIFKVKSKEGFLGPADQLQLQLGDGARIPLAGEWRACVSVDARPPHPLPLGYENYPTMPSVLYDGMIAPVAPLALTGALWYQGEANSQRARQYQTLLPLMISDWRKAFGQGAFPFLIAQLPAFEAHREAPGSDDWAELREAQALTAERVPDCGIAVAIDTGEADNIHPKEKRPVGERLALVALSKVYGEKIDASGPTFSRFDRTGDELRLTFDHVGTGLAVHGTVLGEFSVSGPDRVWHWAKARIEGADTIVISSPEVKEPVAARYAWQANPVATLVNSDGLPALPFRTDDWPGVTDHAAPW